MSDLAASVGRVLDEAQIDVLDGALRERSSGDWAAQQVAVVCPRQNLKTATFEVRALAGLVLFDEPLQIWTSHQFKTTRETIRTMYGWFENYDHLRRLVRSMPLGSGDEMIELKSGARLRFLARQRTTGRGFSQASTIYLDEALELRDAQMAALVPAQAVAKNKQVWFGSSAPPPEATVLRRLMVRGRKGAPRLAYFEWCAPDGAASDDRAAWARANPAYPRRLSAQTIEDERLLLSDEDFRRERLGIVELDEAELGVLDVAEWAAGADRASKAVDPVAFGVDVAPDRSMAVIAAAGRRSDGREHGEIVDCRPGTAWLVDRVVELARRWDPCALALDPKSPAYMFEKPLSEAGFSTDGKGRWRLLLTSTRDYAAACGGLAASVSDGRWRHLGQEVLDRAVAGARSRPLPGGMWAWSGAGIGPLVAVTLARHGFMTWAAGRPAAPFVLTGATR